MRLFYGFTLDATTYVHDHLAVANSKGLEETSREVTYLKDTGR